MTGMEQPAAPVSKYVSGTTLTKKDFDIMTGILKRISEHEDEKYVIYVLLVHPRKLIIVAVAIKLPLNSYGLLVRGCFLNTTKSSKR